MITNVLASLAVKDLSAVRPWYAALLGADGAQPMPGVAEWRLPRGGALQVYELPERAGHGSCTFIVDDLDAVTSRLRGMRVDAGDRTESRQAKTVMITDPDGNHLAFAQPQDPALAR